MTKVKVGMDDPSSVEFVERRRAALERQGSINIHTVTLLMKRYVIFILGQCFLRYALQISPCSLQGFLTIFLPMTVFLCARDHFKFYFCRYLQRVVAHPSLLQDPDVREFLEREEVGFLRYKKF